MSEAIRLYLQQAHRHEQMGTHDEALECLQDALDLIHNHNHRNSSTIIRQTSSIHNRLALLQHLGKRNLQQAHDHYEKAFTILNQWNYHHPMHNDPYPNNGDLVHPPNNNDDISDDPILRSIALANISNNWGLLFMEQGKFEDARICFQFAVDVYEDEMPNSLLLATAYTNAAKLLELESQSYHQDDNDGHDHAYGNQEDALILYEQALAIRQHKMPQSQLVASSLNLIGNMLQTCGEWEDALEHYQQSAVMLEREAPNSTRTGISYANLASVLQQLQDVDGALEYFQRAMLILVASAQNDNLHHHHQNDERVVHHDSYLHSHIAKLLHLKGDLQRAQQYYQTSLEWEQQKLTASTTLTTSSASAPTAAAVNATSSFYRSYYSTRIASLYMNIGSVLHDKGDLKEAIDKYNRAMILCNPSNEEEVDNHNNVGTLEMLSLSQHSYYTATCLNNMGCIQHDRGKFQDAIDLYRRSLVIQIGFNQDSIEAAICYNNVGAVSQDLGEFDEAADFYTLSLAILERLLPDSLSVAIVYTNIGTLLHDIGDIGPALKHFELALTIESRDAPNSLAVATSFANIGLIMKLKGDLDQALELYRHASAIRSRDAPDSLVLASSFTKFGLLLKETGDLEGALEYFERALDINEKEAPESLITAVSYSHIGLAMRDKGFLEDSLGYHRRALAIREKEVPNTLSVAASNSNVGMVYQDSGDLSEALEMYRKALIIENSLAGDSLADATSYDNIGSVFQDKEESGAFEQYSRALGIREKLVDDSLIIAVSFTNLASLLGDKGDFKMAMDFHRRALKIKKRDAPDSLTLACSYHAIGQLLWDNGDFERGKERLHRAMTIRERRAPESLWTAVSYRAWAGILREEGDLEEALQQCRLGLDICNSRAPRSLTTADMYNTLGKILRESGKVVEALENFRDALEIQNKIVPDSSIVSDTYYYIGLAHKALRDFEPAHLHFSLSLNLKVRVSPLSLESAACYSEIGCILREQRKVDAALEKFQLALAIVNEAYPDSPLHATSHYDVGWALKEKGQLDDALDHFRASLNIRCNGSVHPLLIASSHDSIGSVLKGRGDFANAFEEYQCALSIREKIVTDSLEIAVSYTNIGTLLHAQGDIESGLTRHREALHIRKRDGATSVDIASSNNSIGLLLLDDGRTEEALEAFYLALQVQSAEAHSLQYAATLSNIALVLYRKRQFTKSRTSFADAYAILWNARNELGEGHPYFIFCKYYLCRLAITKHSYEEALTHADHLIRCLPDFKWSYQLKGQALKKLERYEESILAYDAAISIAPNFADAHLGRLRVLTLISVESDISLVPLDGLEQRIALACTDILSVEPEKDDIYTPALRQVFEHVKLLENPHLFALPFPKNKWSNKVAFFQNVVSRFGTIEFCDPNLRAEVRAMRHGAIRTLSNREEFEYIYEDVMEESLKQSSQNLALVDAANGDLKRIVGNGTNLVTILSRIENYLVSKTSKAKHVGKELRSTRTKFIQLESRTEKSQALISFLCTGETIPCPKLVILVPQFKAHIDLVDSFVNIFQRRQRLKKPFECKWHCLFLCQESFKITNPLSPMEITLDCELMEELIPMLKASLIAISLVFGDSEILPFKLPFPEADLEENIAEFDLMYKNVADDIDYEIVKSLDKWITDDAAMEWNTRDLLKMKRLVGKSFRAFSLLALKEENRWCWEPSMELCQKEGRIAWIMKAVDFSRNDNDLSFVIHS